MESYDVIFRTPFSKSYWKKATMELKSTRKLVLLSILMAVTIITGVLSNMIGLYFFDRKVLFAFLPTAVTSLIFGPAVGLISGALTDIIGFFIFPTGAFFPGYTLSSMLSGFIYGLFLYRTRISVAKIFLAKLFVNIFVNAFLGAIWLSIMAGNKTFALYLSAGLIKNLVLLPLEVILIYKLLEYLIPISKQYKIISFDIPDQIKLI